MYFDWNKHLCDEILFLEVLCSNTHIQSIVVHRKFFDFADAGLLYAIWPSFPSATTYILWVQTDGLKTWLVHKSKTGVLVYLIKYMRLSIFDLSSKSKAID